MEEREKERERILYLYVYNIITARPTWSSIRIQLFKALISSNELFMIVHVDLNQASGSVA